MSSSRANALALALMGLGCLQMLGGTLGIAPLRGLAAAWGFAPYPKVFSDVAGLETFASEFTLEWKGGSQAITPELYARLKGPYNRRNVYGAALSYAPRLPEAQWQSVFCHGLKPGGPLRDELGLPEDARELKVRIRTKTAGRSDAWTLQAPCVP